MNSRLFCHKSTNFMFAAPVAALPTRCSYMLFVVNDRKCALRIIWPNVKRIATGGDGLRAPHRKGCDPPEAVALMRANQEPIPESGA